MLAMDGQGEKNVWWRKNKLVLQFTMMLLPLALPQADKACWLLFNNLWWVEETETGALTSNVYLSLGLRSEDSGHINDIAVSVALLAKLIVFSMLLFGGIKFLLLTKSNQDSDSVSPGKLPIYKDLCLSFTCKRSQNFCYLLDLLVWNGSYSYV